MDNLKNVNGMNTVIMNKVKLLDHLKSNRAEHIKVFNETMAEYRKDIVTKLEEMVAVAKNGKDVDHYVDLEKPTSHETDYDTVIAMLEWANNDFVELTRKEFENYIENKWSWTERFTASNIMYMAKYRKN